MKTTYDTTVLGFGNHAAIEIPDLNLSELGGNKRSPLKVTVNGYTYQSTATGMNGKCLVVFPKRDRDASKVSAGDKVSVTLELDAGHRNVNVPTELSKVLKLNDLKTVFDSLAYSKRKEFARLVNDAVSDETKSRRIEKIIQELKQLSKK